MRGEGSIRGREREWLKGEGEGIERGRG